MSKRTKHIITKMIQMKKIDFETQMKSNKYYKQRTDKKCDNWDWDWKQPTPPRQLAN